MKLSLIEKGDAIRLLGWQQYSISLLYPMPRKSRIDTHGALHHIMARGIEGGNIFRDDADKKHFLERLEKILKDTETCCYAWALIPNHFHLLLRTGPTPITTVMRRFLTGYAQWFNRRHQRQGHVFHNRYKSIKLEISLSSVSDSVKRGQMIAEENGFDLL